MQMNPRAKMLMQMLRNKDNPQEMMFNMLQQRAGENPMLENLLSLGKQGKTKDVEQIARNMLNSQGLDFDKEFGEFKNELGW